MYGRALELGPFHTPLYGARVHLDAVPTVVRREDGALVVRKLVKRCGDATDWSAHDMAAFVVDGQKDQFVVVYIGDSAYIFPVVACYNDTMFVY
jgi:hypothetical protein